MTTHLFLSPHLDDVVLSVGGLVRALTSSRVRAVVATFCTADPPARLEDLAHEFHRKWQSSEPYVERRNEDASACGLLGAEHHHAGLYDAIYRGGEAGRYHRFDDLFQEIPAWDEAFTAEVAKVIERLVMELAPVAIHAPLAVGGNVDHRHVLRAAQRVAPRGALRFYEDQPYSAGIYGPVPTSDAVEKATASCGFRVVPEVHVVDFAAKSAAIRCYRSQLEELFGADLRGLDALGAYGSSLAEAGGHAERLWRPIEDAESA